MTPWKKALAGMLRQPAARILRREGERLTAEGLSGTKDGARWDLDGRVAADLGTAERARAVVVLRPAALLAERTALLCNRPGEPERLPPAWQGVSWEELSWNEDFAAYLGSEMSELPASEGREATAACRSRESGADGNDHGEPGDTPPTTAIAVSETKEPVMDQRALPGEPNLEQQTAPAAAAAPGAGLQATAPAAGGSGERDLLRGLRFTNLMAATNQELLDELRAYVCALLEALSRAGQIAGEEIEERRRVLQAELAEQADGPLRLELGDPGDKYEVEAVAIDCLERLPLCRARCCHRPFALSTQDLDEGLLRWDYARPYRMPRRDDGGCVYCDAQSRTCAAYQARPARCRLLDCRDDPTIWLDFEARLPAP